MAPSAISEMSRMNRTRETAGLVLFFGLLAFPTLGPIAQAGSQIQVHGDRTRALRGAVIEVSVDREDHDRIIDVRCAVEMPVRMAWVDLVRSAGLMIGTVLRERMAIIRQRIASGCVARVNREMTMGDRR